MRAEKQMVVGSMGNREETDKRMSKKQVDSFVFIPGRLTQNAMRMNGCRINRERTFCLLVVGLVGIYSSNCDLPPFLQ